MKITNKWRKKAEMYKMMRKGIHDSLDFSEKAAQAMFDYESGGGMPPEKNNGYKVGKMWLNWQITEWKKDIKSGLLFVSELYKDSSLPKWFLDSIDFYS